MSGRQKIRGAELAKHSAPLREALEAVCKSTPFRTSPKSCEFLRHIVHHSLEGDTDVLKERLIGMALLGRDASYDTATDAGVRVRANDVRKRLHAHNEGLDSTTKYCFGLPAGTYVPVFYGSFIESPANSQTESPAQKTAPSPALSVYRLATPALVALFLCVIFLRSEFAQSHSFLLFWNHVLPDGDAQLYLQPPHASAPAVNLASESVNGPQDEMDLRALKFAAPLFDLAGQLHHRLTLVGTPAQAADGRLVYIGAAESPAGQPDSLSDLADSTAASLASRFVVRATPTGRRILDRQLPQSNGTSGALLTIVNGPRLLIWIDGVDDDAIRMLVNRLCDQSTFPTALADSFQPYTITQAVFPASQHSKPAVVRLPFRGMHAAPEVAQ
ncbi:hypothetical protein HNQ77_000621 [Silvibacterium bohemicum]|uniref:Uncharacterized protein n=1 Tax=Silvibacterium bohemicum TaxID=1577686 RepID=A0A841JN57_9BACT|nr:hypothetical protein [Silvibacterium bohemicum]MBB6142683.1 hypothetical protein [Silvibacterium bohemicum]